MERQFRRSCSHIPKPRPYLCCPNTTSFQDYSLSHLTAVFKLRPRLHSPLPNSTKGSTSGFNEPSVFDDWYDNRLQVDTADAGNLSTSGSRLGGIYHGVHYFPSEDARRRRWDGRESLPECGCAKTSRSVVDQMYFRYVRGAGHGGRTT